MHLSDHGGLAHSIPGARVRPLPTNHVANVNGHPQPEDTTHDCQLEMDGTDVAAMPAALANPYQHQYIPGVRVRPQPTNHAANVNGQPQPEDTAHDYHLEMIGADVAAMPATVAHPYLHQSRRQ